MIEYKNVSLANQVYDELELKILSGALPKGEVLTEKKLSAEMGVSRTPIREALREDNGLNKAMLICYKNTIKSLVDRNLKICPDTIDVYNELLSVL